MMTVSDHELLEAMRYVWERVKIVVEPTGALGAAGLFKGAHDVRGKRVGIIISGGNVDLKTIAPLIA
jgi:threo-3-hydroxy-L-aspartate ammonia-lyase